MKYFRFCFLSFILILFVSFSSAQKLDSKRYHTIRTNLVNSAIKFEKEKSGRVVFLGGSITYNSGWRDSVCNFIQKNIPKRNLILSMLVFLQWGPLPALSDLRMMF
jgi:hypothetical protein